MKASLRYAAGLGAGFLGLAVVWCALFFASFGLYGEFGDRNVAAWYRIKREAIAATSDRPKIVLAGGSNVLYGLRAKDIERALHVPSVNYGTHAAFPLDYLIDRWKDSLNAGDLLVLSPEWPFLDRDPGEVNDVFVGYMLGADPLYFFELDWPERLRIILSTPLRRLLLPLHLSRKENQQMQTVYREWILAYYVDKFGDYFWNEPSRSDVAHLQNLQAASEKEKLSLKRAQGDTAYWRAMAALAAWGKKNDVMIVFAAPALLDSSDMAGEGLKEYYAAAEDHYEKIGIPVVSRQSENFYPLGQMFDSVYHLNSDGARERTRRLILALTPLAAGRFPEAH